MVLKQNLDSLKLKGSSRYYITIPFAILMFQSDVPEAHHTMIREIIDSPWIQPYYYLIS